MASAQAPDQGYWLPADSAVDGACPPPSGGANYWVPPDSEVGLPILWPPGGGFLPMGGGGGPTVEIIYPRGPGGEYPGLCPLKKPPDNRGILVRAEGTPGGGNYSWSGTPEANGPNAFYTYTTCGLTYAATVTYTLVGQATATSGYLRVFDADLTFEGGDPDAQCNVEAETGFFMAVGTRKCLTISLSPSDPDDVMPDEGEYKFNEGLNPRGLLPPYQVWVSANVPYYVDFYDVPEEGTPLTSDDLFWGWKELDPQGHPDEFTEVSAPAQRYVQAKAPGTCTVDLWLMFRCPEECGDWLTDGGDTSDHVKVTVLGVDLAIDGVPYTQEENPGGFVALGGLRPITLQVLPSTLPPADKATLTWTNDAKIDVYENQDRTNPINPGKTYPLSDLATPKTLYVEGDQASDQPRDIEMKLSYSKGGATAEDLVKVTVVDVVTVDIEAYNGQGGGMVPDPDEETTGVFTVANLNDTDADSPQEGDPVPDTLDNDVPNETDLLKIVLKKPDPDCGGSVTLSLTGDGTMTKVWKSSDKAAGEETLRQFSTGTLPKTLWVEGRQHSTWPRDVEIKLQYTPGTTTFEDKAKATFIWAEKTNFRNSGTSLSPDADGAAIRDVFETSFDSHLGLSIAPWPVGVVNAMEMEFTVYPAGIGAEAGVEFDVTRQINDWTWAVDSGTLEGPLCEDFPVGAYADEMPNDDTDPDDKDNEPTNNHVYSIDGPGLEIDLAVSDFVVILETFREFVRVKFDGTFSNEEKIEGSRCSPRAEWRAISYLKRAPSGKWERDYDEVSASAPVRTGTGNGTMSVPTTGATTVTEGWTVTYGAADGKWTVVGTESGTQTNKATTGTAYTSDDGEVSFTITAGGTPFADGDQFKFSTFRTQRQEGKKNEVEPGGTNVTGNP